MEFFGSYLSVKCRILAGHHEFGRKSQEVIPEKPKMCLKSPRVTVLKHRKLKDVTNIHTSLGAPKDELSLFNHS